MLYNSQNIYKIKRLAYHTIEDKSKNIVIRARTRVMFSLWVADSNHVHARQFCFLEASQVA